MKPLRLALQHVNYFCLSAAVDLQAAEVICDHECALECILTRAKRELHRRRTLRPVQPLAMLSSLTNYWR